MNIILYVMLDSWTMLDLSLFRDSSSTKCLLAQTSLPTAARITRESCWILKNTY